MKHVDEKNLARVAVQTSGKIDTPEKGWLSTKHCKGQDLDVNSLKMELDRFMEHKAVNGQQPW